MAAPPTSERKERRSVGDRLGRSWAMGRGRECRAVQRKPGKRATGPAGRREARGESGPVRRNGTGQQAENKGGERILFPFSKPISNPILNANSIQFET